MNNKAFALNDLLIGLGIIGFALILVTVLLQSKFKEVDALLRNDAGEESKSESFITYTYEDMETELISSATKYMEHKMEEGSSYKNHFKITMDTLVEYGLYTSVKDPKNPEENCEGYVMFQKKGLTISYTPYLKCGKNYETKD